ncbi:MAG: hypothetical protein ABGU93_05500 [Acetobacterium sp.]|uniref:hypothetical protein n=1 Tax=Acetobacterium sp. TaxID=1872094 RepID=UPI0032429AD1
MEKTMQANLNNQWNQPGELNSVQYLNHLVTLKKALHGLNRHPDITLCNNDLGVHVYQGIGELAAAAGQTLTVSPRNCRDFPLELTFVYQGVRFCELKSAEVLQSLSFVK